MVVLILKLGVVVEIVATVGIAGGGSVADPPNVGIPDPGTVAESSKVSSV